MTHQEVAPIEQEIEPTEHTFKATQSSGVVSALLTCPANADCLLVLGHGAGAGMRHVFMETLAGPVICRHYKTACLKRFL